MKHWLMAATLLCATPAAIAADFRIENTSSWDIMRIYVSSTDDDEWGTDQLDDDILASGQTLTLSGVECDYYDVKLVDEDDDVCVVNNVKMCKDVSWTIDDEALLMCQNQQQQ